MSEGIETPVTAPTATAPITGGKSLSTPSSGENTFSVRETLPINKETATDDFYPETGPFASGPKPAGNVLNSVKEDGVDETFENLASGKFNQQKEEKSPLTPPASQTDSNEPQKPREEQPEEKLKEKVAQPEMIDIEKLLEEMRRLREENERLKREMELMREKLKDTQIVSIADGRKIHELKETLGNNEETMRMVVFDLENHRSKQAV